MANVLDEVRRNKALYAKVNWNAAIVQKILGLGYVPEPSMESLVHDVKRFQKQEGLDADGILGPATWERIQTLNMTPKERAIKKVIDRCIIFESGGRYDALNLDGEFRGLFKNHDAEGKVHIGLSAGLIQFTQDGGSLGKLLALMAKTDEALFKTIVGDSWLELLSVTGATGSSGLQRFRAMTPAQLKDPSNFPIRGPRVKPVQIGDVRRDLWEPEWQKVMKALLNHPTFKPCQWTLALELYLDPIKGFLQANKLTSEVSVACAFNLSVHRGASGATRFIANRLKPNIKEQDLWESIGAVDKRVGKIIDDKTFTYNVWGGW